MGPLKRLYTRLFKSGRAHRTLSGKSPEIGDDPIVYVIRPDVADLLVEEIKKAPKGVFLLLSHRDQVCTISVGRDFDRAPSVWVRKTNRKALLSNKKLYPLIFQLDMWFAATDDADAILKTFESKNRPFFQTYSWMLREGFYVVFTRRGGIIQSGHGIPPYNV